jgi:hypothetical protein
MLIAALVVIWSRPAGIAIAIAASASAFGLTLTERRREALVRAAGTVDLAAIEKLARTAPKKPSAWQVLDSVRAVGRFEALRALVVVGGTERFRARPTQFAICTVHDAIGDDDDGSCPMCALDRELGLVVDAVVLMERGEHEAASRLLWPIDQRLDPKTTGEALVQPFRCILAVVARSIARSDVADLERIEKMFPTLRWLARVTAALVAHRKGRDASALLREVPRHPDGSLVEVVRASIHGRFGEHG